MIRVLHILTRLIRGGADEAVLLLVTGLNKTHFDVTLLTGGDSDRAYVAQASQKGVKILLEPSLRREVKPCSDILALAKLYGCIKRGKYDIVHTHTAKAGFVGRLAAKMAGAPVIVHTLHGITFHNFRRPFERAFYLFLEKAAATVTDRFIAVGENLQAYYLRHKIGRPEQYTVIHTGMDIDRFLKAGELPEALKQKKRREFHLAPADIVIGNVARLDPGKGQQFLLQAAPQIVTRFPNVKFMLVGDGRHRETFENLTRELHLERHVIFAGFRPDIEEIMAIFDIAVFTSLWEGLPRVIVQYAAVGKPIVAFDISGVTELVRNGINGFTVPLKDVDRFAKRILYLLENQPEAIGMGLAGRQLLDDSWRVEVMISRITQEYRRLLERNRR